MDRQLYCSAATKQKAHGWIARACDRHRQAMDLFSINVLAEIGWFGRFQLHRSNGHLAASLGATTARFGAALTVIHVVCVALICTPVADVRAQYAGLLGERAVAGSCIGAQPTDRRALNATGWTRIRTLLAEHVRETVAALGRAVVTGLDAVLGTLVQMMTHGVFPFVEVVRSWRVRNTLG